MPDDELTSSELLILWRALSGQDRERISLEICRAVMSAPLAPPPRKRGRPIVAPGMELQLWRAWEAFLAENPEATIRFGGARFMKRLGVKTSRQTLTRLLATGKKMDAASKRLDALLAEGSSFIKMEGGPTLRETPFAGLPSFVVKLAQ